MICVQSAPSKSFRIDSICRYFKKQFSEWFLTLAYAVNDNDSVSLPANTLSRVNADNSLVKYFCA